MKNRDGGSWPRRVWGVMVDEIHPGLLAWELAGNEWRWHFWGGAITRDGKHVMNATGSPGRIIAFSQGFEEGLREGKDLWHEEIS